MKNIRIQMFAETVLHAGNEVKWRTKEPLNNFMFIFGNEENINNVCIYVLYYRNIGNKD